MLSSGAVRQSVPDPPAVEDRDWDVVVVGAGPAGCTAALHLATQGHAVLLIDRQPFPRDKVCGDALIPDALRSLRRIGLYEQVRARGYTADAIEAFSPSRIRVRVAGEFITLRRRTMDDLLLKAAVARGATFRVGNATHVEPGANGRVAVGFGNSARRVCARVGVIATGADIALSSKLGIVRRRQPSAVALRCYVRSPVTIDELIISFDRSILPGYAWIFPLGGTEYNVGCGFFYRGTHSKKTNLRQVFATFTREFPLARELLRRGEMTTPLQGAMLRCGLEGAVSYDGHRILAIGEAIGATFDFTGEGIGKAMETGEVAARQIHRALVENSLDHLGRFPQTLKAELAARYVGYRVAANWLSQRWLNDLVARRVRSDATLQAAVAGLVDETVDPRAVFSWRLFLPHWFPWKARAN